MPLEMRTFRQAKQDICGITNDPERLRAAHEVVYRSNLMRQVGWRQLRWRAGPKAPWSIKTEYGWDLKSRPHWLDHPYRLVNKDTQREVFVAEPYGIDNSAWADFIELQKEGWTVNVEARFALHFPGSTIAIWIEKKREE